MGMQAAIGAGFTAEKILEFLMRKSPDMKEKIAKSLAAGFTADRIVKFFSKDRNFQKLKDEMEQAYPLENNANPIVQAQNVRSQNLGSDMASGLQRAAGPLLGTAASAAASYALGRALPKILQSGEAPTNLTSAIQGQTQTPLETPVLQTSQPPVNAPSIPQVAESLQPERISSKLNIKDLLSKHGILKRIEQLKEAGTSNEEIAKFVKETSPYEMSKLEKESGESADKIVSQYLSESAPEEQKAKPVEVAQTVIAPQGVGEVKAIRNGKAIVEIDSKKHQIDEDELESSPIPEKDLDDLYDDLLRGIEKETGEDVSRMVQWAGYNPDTNTLQFLPHTGDLYTYDDISEEDAALLRDVLSVRKTSGSNFIGAWKKDSKSPIGAALSKLIRKLQSERGGKGQEYSAKHGTIYSAYEPAIQAKKKKKKK